LSPQLHKSSGYPRVSHRIHSIANDECAASNLGREMRHILQTYSSATIKIVSIERQLCLGLYEHLIVASSREIVHITRNDSLNGVGLPKIFIKPKLNVLMVVSIAAVAIGRSTVGTHSILICHASTHTTSFNSCEGACDCTYGCSIHCARNVQRVTELQNVMLISGIQDVLCDQT
jgi:hypothetical protein